MKYVALLSGGKDSCFNLLHCARNGHELVAAASLGPEPGKEELDSYMYQTVGQDAIELVARALDVPLHRRVISGQALEQGSEYGTRNNAKGRTGDETEDLYALLSTVKSHRPDIEGVSVGAILSNYQRVRVEHVCRRLSLTPLCYLWQRDQGKLMAEMIAAGMEAILIKVAGIGLTAKHLGNTLAQMEPTFIKLNNLYGAHICGEGGEYETLTLDCPLFKHRIVLIEVETRTLQPKFTTERPVLVPEVLDEAYAQIRDSVASLKVQEESQIQDTWPLPGQPSFRFFGDKAQSRRLGSWIAVSNVHSNTESRQSIEEEVAQCFAVLQAELAKYSLELPDCANINIFLSSMDLFSSVNAIYITFFGTSPPARACVAVDLPAPRRVMLECIAHSRTAERYALHVQGLSYWAPANIGPYSQAVMTDEQVFISGQIGLIPASLSLPAPQSLALETALSLQHVERVTRAISTNTGGWAGHTQLALYWLTNIGHLSAVRRGHSALESETAIPTLFLVVENIPKSALVEKQVLLHTGRIMIPDEDDGELVIQNRTPNFQQGAQHPLRPTSQVDVSQATVSMLSTGKYHGSTIRILPALLYADATVEIPIRWLMLYGLSMDSNRSGPGPFSALYDGFFETPQPPISFIPCRNISSQNQDGWDYAICILTQ
ncbi:Diphthine--ammonia ligase [Mycena sanguinolenta]|uniref:Diphthine--ammonia ligase n=1 Tax=Mycena sanguinolenta TaxID=230812 RepID=A0A8H6Y8Z6_9AGAR|nr:Diphthine--ammonia ligase [Mycena sanguinolenta]